MTRRKSTLLSLVPATAPRLVIELDEDGDVTVDPCDTDHRTAVAMLAMAFVAWCVPASVERTADDDDA